LYRYIEGELESGMGRLSEMSGDAGFLALFITALLAGMLLNYALFLCTLTNSALTTTVVGVLKGVASTLLGFFLLGGVKLSALHVAGITINTSGGVAYTCVTFQEKQLRRLHEKNSNVRLPDLAISSSSSSGTTGVGSAGSSV
jgi:solute carrier family 35 protein